MNRTVDHVPTRAETDRLRALREDQLPTANARAQEEPVLSIAVVTTPNQPPRPERVSRPLQRSGITDVAGHTLLLRTSDVERVLLRRPHGAAVIAAMVTATLMAIPCSTFMGVFRICADPAAQTVRIVPRVPWAGNDVRVGIRSRP